MNRERIFGRLGPTAYDTLVEATALGRSRRHALVDLDHWLLCLLRRGGGDVALLLEALDCEPAAALQRVGKALDAAEAGGESLRDISPALERSVAPAISWSQVAAPAAKVRSGHLLLAWLDEEPTRRWLQHRIGQALAKLSLDDIVARYEALAGAWPEAADAPAGTAAQGAAGEAADPAAVLRQWAVSLSEQAAAGELDPVIGRDAELRAVIDVLSRRRQNNPILVGEAGVGKTAVAEALAQRIHRGEVPPGLRGAQIWALDVARLQAGAGARGEFEQRLRSVIDAVIAAPAPVILFCDETHTLIGAGGNAGTGDAANLIKPMLARGQLRMVAATTWSEYKQFIEPDAALVRRFQTVAVDEPDDDTAVDMLRMIAPRFAGHHGVRIVDAALRAAVTLSRRYLPSRQLPDKAIGLLDTACARVAMSQSCQPAALDRLRHRAMTLEQALNWRASDARLGLAAPADGAELEREREETAARADALDAALSEQRAEVGAWLEDLETGGADPERAEALSGAERLVRPWVDAQAIAEVLSEWTQVPVTQMAQDEARRLMALREGLNQRIQGQESGLDAIVEALQVAHSGLGDPRRPMAVMLLAGPTGTGKSQTAAELAQALFGGERNLLRFNMNEFQEAHTVSTLKGAPPGYVGYGRGGRLTEAVRKKPYSVLLLDEFDRAHPDVHEMFYQVFDQGWMEDGEGRHINFRNCLILLTSNLGDAEIEAACAAEPEVSQSRLDALARERLQRRFAPALLARMRVVAFRPLGEPALAGIARQALDDIGQRLSANGLDWRADAEAADWIARAVARHPASGRAVGDLLRQRVMPAIARGVLEARAADRALHSVRLSAAEKLELIFDDGEGVPLPPAAPAESAAPGETACV
ncbi:type VI secretion system ATPase TssH [Chromobacterium sp. Panama]|uniref:type VI secretion system ATPase TssH n=1 Tax=Chromobacterium sp. Panama TaxID=2161826 RepID=UPI000D311F93|nr:type VI secretion system ATPase TssH [Chromobacterium sp. Panama]PTU64955.1 type VI secretion system ATPase TssH [Chromobacterium sp. Panama]